MEPELVTIFAREHMRLTKPRRQVFTYLKNTDKPQSAAKIARHCDGSDRTSVYRTLDLFVRLGIANAVPIGWKRRYELAEPFSAHHHHLSCSVCGALIDVHSPKLEDAMATVAAEHGFSVQSHTFEIRGVCARCRAMPSGGASR